MFFCLFKHIWPNLNIQLCILIAICVNYNHVHALKHYTKERKLELREQVRSMFQHAYEGYLKYASDYDELRPLTCDGIDTWGSYSLTMIDSLDTLATMGNFTEFRRIAKVLEKKMDFNRDINVSVFETNIRIVGGLLSAHLLSKKAGVELEAGWPCQGPLLRMAEDVAKRLLPAFDTATGMPYGTVNLRYGVPKGETSITCTAGVGTLLVEFGTLSRLTGNTIYEEVALNALHSLWNRRSPIGLFGNHIDVQSGRWTALDSGIGAGVDSLFEYMVKAGILLQRPELLEMFHTARAAIDKYLRHEDWYVWANMNKGQVTLPVFQSLEAFWPGILSMVGDREAAIKTIANYASVWRKYGFLPEFYTITTGEAASNRESYPLRPELIESVMYLYRATKNEFLLELGESILQTIEHSAKTRCGYATIRNVVTHEKENRMESFFLSETTKYLFLLFDEDNFLHNDASKGDIVQTPQGGECLVNTGPYIFNTEAHPVDISALYCCYDHKQDIFDGMDLQNFSDSALAKKDYELHIKGKSDINAFCSKFQRKQRERHKKSAAHPPVPPSSKSPPQPTLAVDIEVFDEDNKPAGDILVESFERVKNDQTSRPSVTTSTSTSSNVENSQSNQLTVSDLQEFFAKKREHFKSPQDILDYTVGFLKNFTLDPTYISSLKLFDKNFNELLGTVTQKEYEGSTKTLWELYELNHRYKMNMQFLIAFNLQSFGEFDRKMVDKVILVLHGDQSDSSNNFIWNKMSNLYMEYTRSLTNTTDMQNLLLKILINGSEEKQRAYKAFLTNEEIQNLPIETVDVSQQLQLFSYAKRIVEAEKRMSDTLEQLQTLMLDINNKQKRDNKISKSSDTTQDDNQTKEDLIELSSKTKSNSPAQKHSPSDNTSTAVTSPMIGGNLIHHSSTKENENGSVWTHLVDTFLGKTSMQKPKFDPSELLQKTRKSLEKYNQIDIDYSLLTCARPKFIENFAYRYYYP
ncbi:ER degradation-enhancing alpha-mannosidase-like protein 2 [Haematobia irritans]|uniref:ER degradation-enhancing alpha-mannosidase-like protein 2 n=1 Tax=Haematobia irritans TaxID=7368 RepID=UPI003F5044BA